MEQSPFDAMRHPLVSLVARDTAEQAKASEIRERMLSLVVEDAIATYRPGGDPAVYTGYVRILTMLRKQSSAEWWLQFADISTPDDATVAAAIAFARLLG